MFSGIAVFASRYGFSFDFEEVSTILIPKIKSFFLQYLYLIFGNFEFFIQPRMLLQLHTVCTTTL